MDEGVTTRDQMNGATAGSALLTDDLMAMDVADSVRRAGEAGGQIETLREAYRQDGLEVADNALMAGIAAAADNRFGYSPPRPGFKTTLARLYVARQQWLPSTVAVLLMFVISFGGFFLVYRPWHDAQVRQAQLELTVGMPAQMDALYQTIFDETKIQQAANDANDIRTQGKEAAAKGDRAGAQQAIDSLTGIRDTLRLEYQLKVVDRPDSKWGFWSFPRSNSDATNYYLVVEALDANDRALKLPVRNEDTGRTETVSMWGERVPEEVYRAVESDKDDDGVIQHNLVGIKDFGFLEPDYTVDVLGGQVTRW